MKYKLKSTRSGYSTSTTIKEVYNKVNGPKVDYTQYFMSAPKAPVYYTPKVKSDEEILKEAKDRYSNLYDTYIKTDEKTRDYNVGVLRDELQSLSPQYETRLQSLQDSYKKKDRELRNNALSQGMGRSSYAADIRAENERNRSQETNLLERERVNKEKQIRRDIEGEYVNYENRKDEYNAIKDAKVKELTEELKRDRADELFAAQKYNNDLYENYNKLLLNQKKHNLNVQKYIDAINTVQVTVTKKVASSGSSSYKVDYSLDRDEVLAKWNSLDGKGKVSYMDDYGYAIKKDLPDLYKKFNVENSKYLITSALTNTQNMFR